MNKYQSLVAWKRAHALAVTSLRITDAAYHPRARPVFEQLRRAAVSVEANIVEGYALGTRPLFFRHLRIAMGSAAEAECLIRLGAELGYLSQADVAALTAITDECLATLRGLLRAPPPIKP